ncbi:Uncharacterized protein TPS_03460 [Trichinella pseudospiralis]
MDVLNLRAPELTTFSVPLHDMEMFNIGRSISAIALRPINVLNFFGQWDVAFDGRLVASFGYIETTGHRFGCTRRIVGVDVFSVRRQAGREEFVPIGLFPFLNRAHPLHNGAHIRCCCWPLCCGENSTLILSVPTDPMLLQHISEWK